MGKFLEYWKKGLKFLSWWGWLKVGRQKGWLRADLYVACVKFAFVLILIPGFIGIFIISEESHIWWLLPFLCLLWLGIGSLVFVPVLNHYFYTKFFGEEVSMNVESKGMEIKVKRSLRPEIIFILSFVLIIILAAATVVNIFYQNKVLLNRQIESNRRLVDTILVSIHQPMMAGDQNAIQSQFDKFKEFKGIKNIYLTDHNGIIKRSTDHSLISNKPLTPHIDQALKGEEIIGIEASSRTKSKTYVESKPILNEQTCYQCHSSEEKVLGVLRVAIDWGPVEKTLLLIRNRSIMIFIVSLVFIIGVLIYVFKSYSSVK